MFQLVIIMASGVAAPQKRPAQREALISQRIAVRRLREIRFVQRPAEFAAINFGLRTDQRFNLFRIIVPALQMPAAQLPLCVLLIASPLSRLLGLNLWRDGRCRFRGSCSDGSSRCCWCRCWKCWRLWSIVFSHFVRAPLGEISNPVPAENQSAHAPPVFQRCPSSLPMSREKRFE